MAARNVSVQIAPARRCDAFGNTTSERLLRSSLAASHALVVELTPPKDNPGRLIVSRFKAESEELAKTS
jgi:hypothetical protein